jgi:hypothetical protein
MNAWTTPIFCLFPRELADVDRRVELQPLRERAPAPGRQAAQPGEVVELVARRQFAEVGRVAAQVREPAMQPGRIRPGVEAEH